MKIIAMMLARDEAWCIGLSARVALQWCDELIVLDHQSGDETPRILEQVAREHPGRVHVVREEHAPFNEADFRQRLLEQARSRGMTHGAIIDADELLTANLVTVARQLVAGVGELQYPMIPMRSPVGSMDEHRTDEAFREKWIGVWFKDHPSLCYTSQSDGYHYHQRHPRGVAITHYRCEKFGGGGGWHLQSISRRRLEVKSAFYKVLERVHFPGKHSIEQLNAMYDWTLAQRPIAEPTPAHWIDGYRELIERHLDADGPVWQLERLRELLAKHPRSLFEGLELHQVA
jgi:hypothetical protein